MYHEHLNTKDAKINFELAQQATGMKSELTGVLGKRTKYQTFKTAQLHVKAKSREDEEKKEEQEEKKMMPSEVKLDEDNVLLEKKALDVSEEETKLRILDQAILLAQW
jgi:hypothetical protein